MNPREALALVEQAGPRPHNPIQVLIDMVDPPAIVDVRSQSHLKFLWERRRNQCLNASLKTVVEDHLDAQVLPKLDRYNKRFAIRVSDLINLRPRLGKLALTLVRGKGTYRRWTNEAVQRACFGRGWTAALKRRTQGKQALGKLRPSDPRRRNVQASSAGTVADFYCSSHTHVHKLWQKKTLFSTRQRAESWHNGNNIY
jgi:hypothetical protein